MMENHTITQKMWLWRTYLKILLISGWYVWQCFSNSDTVTPYNNIWIYLTHHHFPFSKMYSSVQCRMLYSDSTNLNSFTTSPCLQQAVMKCSFTVTKIFMRCSTLWNYLSEITSINLPYLQACHNCALM
jgi:hypothetical protein